MWQVLNLGLSLGQVFLHRVRRGSDRVRRGLVRVRRGSESAASAYCKAGPSWNLARHPRGGPLPSGSNEKIKSGTRREVYIKYYM